MKTCYNCGRELLNESDKGCYHCGIHLVERCEVCCELEPHRFVEAGVCYTEAKKVRDEFYEARRDLRPWWLIISGVGIFLLSLYHAMFGLFIVGLSFLFCGLFFYAKKSYKNYQEFKHFDPKLAELFLDN